MYIRDVESTYQNAVRRAMNESNRKSVRGDVRGAWMGLELVNWTRYDDAVARIVLDEITSVSPSTNHDYVFRYELTTRRGKTIYPAHRTRQTT